jgi:hypothetical protein
MATINRKYGLCSLTTMRALTRMCSFTSIYIYIHIHATTARTRARSLYRSEITPVPGRVPNVFLKEDGLSLSQ